MQRPFVVSAEWTVRIVAALTNPQIVRATQVPAVLLAHERPLHDLVRAGGRELADDSHVARAPLGPDVGQAVHELRERDWVEHRILAQLQRGHDLVASVLVGIVPYTDLNDAAPIAKAVNQIGLPWFAVLVKIGAICGLSSVILVLLYGQTRIFYTMARDGLIPPLFSRVHPKFKTPWINTLIVGVIAAAFAGFMGLDELANVTNVGTLLAFAIVCFTVVYLRYARAA